MRQKSKFLGLFFFLFLLESCSINGKFASSVAPPYVDYTFYFGKFKYFVNADIYGISGKGKYNIFQDTLVFEFADVDKEESIVKVDIESEEKNSQIFDFTILDKRNKLSLPGAYIYFYDSDSNLLKEAQTDIDGELEVNIDNQVKVDRVSIQFVGLDPIEIKKEFGSKNTIYIEWHSDWLTIISNETFKYKIIKKKQHIISFETERGDTIDLIRKRILRNYFSEKISREQFENIIK